MRGKIMKQIFLKTVLFIPATIALILCRIVVHIPAVKRAVIDRICLLLKEKEEKETYLIALSEAPDNKMVDKLIRLRYGQLRFIDAKIKILGGLFGIKKKHYAHIVRTLRG